MYFSFLSIRLVGFEYQDTKIGKVYLPRVKCQCFNRVDHTLPSSLKVLHKNNLKKSAIKKVLTLRQNHTKMSVFTSEMRQSSGFRFFIYCMFLLLGALISVLMSIVISEPDNINNLRLAQSINSSFLFIVPPFALYATTQIGRASCRERV